MENVAVKLGSVFMLALFINCFDSASATTCTDVGTSLEPCLGALNGLTLVPPTPCCNGLKVIVELEKVLGLGATCDCTKGLLMNVPGLDVDVKVSGYLQNNCNVNLGFSLASRDSCAS